jgi:hypothetical protein
MFYACSWFASFRCIEPNVFCWSKFGGPSAWRSRTIRVAQVSLGLSTGRVRTVRISRCSTSCSGFFFGSSAASSRTVRLLHTDCPPGHHGLSTPGCAELLSPLLLEFRFRFGIIWGLFLGLVGLLWLCDLDKLVWESFIVNSGHRLSSTFGKNFYRLPSTSPSLVA